MCIATNEGDKRMRPKEEISSPSPDEGNSRKCPAPGDTLKKGPWTSAEDKILIDYVNKHGEGNWNSVQKNSGLLRCGKSCRLRWANHLRPNLKKVGFTQEEELKIAKLHFVHNNKWALMATHLPERTDNEIKNYWNTRIKRCERTNTPLYPPSIFAEGSDGNQSCDEVCSDNNKQNSFLLSGNNHDFSNPMIDSFKVNQGTMPFATIPFPNICHSDVLKCFPSQGLGITNPAPLGSKRFRDWGTSFTGFQGGFPNMVSLDMPSGEPPNKIPRICSGVYAFDPNPDGEQLAPIRGMVPGGHTLLNEIFSASGPLYGTTKLELPSLQHPEKGLDLPRRASMLREAVDARVMIPLAQSMGSDRSSLGDGFFESLLSEPAKELDQITENSSAFSEFTASETMRSLILNNEFDEYSEHESSGCAISVLDQFPPHHQFCDYGGMAPSSGQVFQPDLQGAVAVPSDAMPSQMDFVGRDEPRFSDSVVAESFREIGASAYLCAGDSSNESEQVLHETPSSLLYGIEPEAYLWNNAPHDAVGDAHLKPSGSSRSFN